MQQFSIQNIHKQQQSIVCCKITAHFFSESCGKDNYQNWCYKNVVIKNNYKMLGSNSKAKSLILIQHINKKINGLLMVFNSDLRLYL